MYKLRSVWRTEDRGGRALHKPDNKILENPRFSSVWQNAWESLESVRTFEKDAVIYSQGETADCFYYLKSGSVKIFVVSEDGREKTLSVSTGGSIIGEAAFFDGCPRISSARAISRCELAAVSRDRLMVMISGSPQLAMELFALQAQTIRMLSQQLGSITFLSARGRIAQVLLRSLSVSDNNVILTTHEDIANMVGTSRITVSKILARLASQGIISTGYRSVTVLEPELLALCCGDKA